MQASMLDRITADPKIFGGKPIIRGMRISVELILNLLAQGEPVEAILDDYRNCRSRTYGLVSLTRTPSSLMTASTLYE